MLQGDLHVGSGVGRAPPVAPDPLRRAVPRVPNGGEADTLRFGLCGGVQFLQVHDYIRHRRGEAAKDATIQRELEAIRRAFALAAEQRRLGFVPVVPTLAIGDSNARQGFLSRAEFEALVGNIGEMRGRPAKFTDDDDLKDFVSWAWWTGMRKGEIAALTWDALDRETWTLRLHAGDAKTGRGRLLALEGPLRKIIDRRLDARRLDVPLIFHRDGKAVREFKKSWATACKRAGLPGILFHDLRRSAIRNMVRAGVDTAVAMRISGHRTRNVFDRYNITSQADLRAAVQQTEEHISALPSQRVGAALERSTA